jgi:hypothetical protein
VPAARYVRFLHPPGGLVPGAPGGDGDRG